MISERNINLHLYTGNLFLLPFKEQIEQIFTTTIRQVLQVIPLSDIDIDVYAGALKHAEESGIIGHTENLHHISVSIMPHHERFQDILSHDLAGTIAHELHHVARWRARGIDKTFLDSLISEGLAGHFETEITHTSPSLCFTFLPKEAVEELLPKAMEEFNKKEYSHEDWFMGSKKRGIPQWAGYGIGYLLVEKYLQKHPEATPSSLVLEEANSLLA